MEPQKTALLHYWLVNRRGGENVLAEFCRLWPEADIFTHAWNPEAIGEPFSSHRIVESFIGRLPGARRNCQKYLPLMPVAIRRLDLSGYKLIVSSESGPIKGVRKPKEALHVCYCHTPMRYLWDMYEDYYRTTGLAGKAAMRIFRDYLRRYDLASAGSVDAFIANSGFVADRIRRIYGRESTVIYPPVESGFFREAAGSPKEDYYLFVGQLIAYKRPDLAIAACRKLGRRLILVVRETPLSLIHLRNLTALAECGAVVLPAAPSFYARPADIESLCATVTERIVALVCPEAEHYEWGAES